MMLTKLKAAAAGMMAIGLLTWVATGSAAVGPLETIAKEAGKTPIVRQTPLTAGAARGASADQADAAGNATSVSYGSRKGSRAGWKASFRRCDLYVHAQAGRFPKRSREPKAVRTGHSSST